MVTVGEQEVGVCNIDGNLYAIRKMIVHIWSVISWVEM
jgi:hypothetical protein